MRRRKSTIFFVVLGVLLIALAIALQVGWILLNLQQIALLVLGIVFFALLITGLVLNTTFLVREIRKNEQQDAFLNAVTHELKTPLASIRLYLQTLKQRDLSPEKRSEFYDIMLADSDRLLGTVEQVLAASKTKEKTRRSKAAPVDLREVVAESAAQIVTRYNLPEKAIKITDGSDALMIEADREELQTVFLNLLDNAVKYSGDDPDIAVKFRLRSTGMAEVHVKDRGRGIPSSELKSIFKRFYRVRGSGASDPKGTGLGLFIVRSIVGSYGGRILVKSKGLNKGSTFIVRLPVSE
ncbi:MAG: HAMP domain-containing histidine kinase [Acidobacteriota bacterium]|nr:MAG: HAMP domain-containing histidine kinase [Acidobacteriota bacterium]